MKFSQLVSILLCAAAALAHAESGVRFELRDGDRVAFIGGTFVEREQEEGHIETMLTRAFAGRDVTFRNLGWSGDTVDSPLNASIPSRPKYVPGLLDYVERLKPTVMFVSYGMMESFNGDAGLPKFVNDYSALLDKLAATTTRIVLVSPIRHEELGGAWPDPHEHNRNLKSYVEATARLATERGYTFINLFDSLDVAPKARRPLTDNGVHLSAEGYQRAADAIQKALGLSLKRLDAGPTAALRAAIQHKNKQWWYHYRPMNSEYVYPKGSRYQNKLGPVELPLYSEIEEFAQLAEQGDANIAQLRQRIMRGEKIAAPKKQVALSRPTQRDPSAPDPELERQTFKVADGFEVNLFAADPLINKPVQIAFDTRGRLWVATTTKYPQIKPGETADDKIIILEDTNGDGRADKTTVFADDLLIPTGILPGNGGAYVFDDTTLLFYRDTDGDGRADRKQIVLSGFGTEDSHHKGHVLRWGPGGHLYFNQGVFLHTTVETPYGVIQHAGAWNPAGIFEYHPPSGRFGIYLAQSVPPNPWGHYWNRWGFSFHIDSSGQNGSCFVLPTANKTSTAMNVPGGGGKLSGAEIITGRHLPDDWQGNLLSSPFKENRVARWAFSDDGSGYALKSMPPLIVSTDTAFRPVESRMGPDGAIYIADWYNPLIGHMQHHFRDPGRDLTHGRIWRVTAKGRPLVPRPQLAGVPVKRVLEHLKDPEDYTREQAKRALAERNPREVLPALATWAKALDTAHPDYDHHRIEALWSYQSLNVVEPNLLRSVLRAEDYNARAAATRVLMYWHEKIPDALDLLATLVADEQARVRLQAVITLSHIPEPRALELAAMATDRPMDRYIEQALKNTARALWPRSQSAFRSGELSFGGNTRRMEFVLQAVGSKDAVKPLVQLLKTEKIAPGDIAATMDLIATLGDAGDLAEIHQIAIRAPDPAVQAHALAVLRRAALERKIVPAVELDFVQSALQAGDENLRIEAARLAGVWRAKTLRTELTNLALSENNPLRLRQAAAEGIASLGDNASLAFLETLAASKQPLAETAVIGLLALDLPKAATNAAALLASGSHSTDPTPLFNAFLQRKGGVDALAAALAHKTIPPDAAKLGLRAMQAAGRQEPALTTLLAEAAGFNAEIKPLNETDLTSLAAEVLAKGDPARGETVFRRPELSCFQCHAINGAGGIVGPDLSATGTGSTVEYLIDAILFPNKVVKDGFETVEVTTRDDEYVLGIKVRESKMELVLKDAARDEIIIPISAIEERKDKSGVSIMPGGLANSLTHAELLDLTRFLAELGKPGPYANNPKPIFRRWQVLQSANPEGTVRDLADIAANPNAFHWMPAYSLVSGVLPLSDVLQPPNATGFARAHVEITTPGKILLRIGSARGLSLWVDGKPVALKGETEIELDRGVRTFTFRVDAAQFNGDGLCVELDQAGGSAGRFQIVSGR